jgi:hypothetical protein
MTQRAPKIRYNLQLLTKFCIDNQITLLKDYSGKAVNRETEISGKCLTHDCENNFDKKFRILKETGGYCDECTKNESNKKRQDTSFANTGFAYSFQTLEFKEKAAVSKKNNPEKLKESNKKKQEKYNNSIPYDKSFASFEGMCCGAKNNSECISKNCNCLKTKVGQWSNKNELKPEQVCRMSDKVIWFDCPKCNHDFNSVLKSVTKKTWCPYCNSSALCYNNECNKCYEKSLASFPGMCCGAKTGEECIANNCNNFNLKVGQWSDENRDQPEGYCGLYIRPRDINYYTNYKYKFNCSECNHTFTKNISTITNMNSWCPYCYGDALCDNNDCEYCNERSFASFKGMCCRAKNIEECIANNCNCSKTKVGQWSDKNELKSRQIIKGTHKEYLFNCHKCNHEFTMKIYNIVSKNCWCQYCAGKKLCEDDTCEMCYKNSLASHPKAKYWNYTKNHNINPRQISGGDQDKYHFICEKAHSIKKAPSDIRRGEWCPSCYNKSETAFYKEILLIIKSEIKRHYKPNWCPSKDFDFVLEDDKILIELDGEQHFKQVSNWQSPEETIQNDKYKDKCANENGYSMIRIIRTDFMYNKYDWKTELLDNIEKIINEKIIQNIYMCKNNEYSLLKDQTLGVNELKQIVLIDDEEYTNLLDIDNINDNVNGLY